jgi:hypothetical protein
VEELTQSFMPATKMNTMAKGYSYAQQSKGSYLNNQSMGGFSHLNEKGNLSISSISNITNTNTKILTPSKLRVGADLGDRLHQKGYLAGQNQNNSMRSSSPSTGLMLPTSSKKIKLTKLVGKLNKSLEDFFLNDCTPAEDSSFVDDLSMMQHYNMLGQH